MANAEDLPNIPDAPPPTPQQSVQSVEQPQAPAEAVEIGEAPVVKQRTAVVGCGRRRRLEGKI